MILIPAIYRAYGGLSSILSRGGTDKKTRPEGAVDLSQASEELQKTIKQIKGYLSSRKNAYDDIDYRLSTMSDILGGIDLLLKTHPYSALVIRIISMGDDVYAERLRDLRRSLSLLQSMLISVHHNNATTQRQKDEAVLHIDIASQISSESAIMDILLACQRFIEIREAAPGDIQALLEKVRSNVNLALDQSIHTQINN